MHKQDIIDHLREDIQRYQRKIVALELSIQAVHEAPLAISNFVHDPEPKNPYAPRSVFNPFAKGTSQAGVWAQPQPPTKPEPAPEPPPQAQATVQEAPTVEAIEAVPEDVLETDPRLAPDSGKEPEHKPSVRGKFSREDILAFVRKAGASGRTVADMTEEFGIGKSGMTSRAHDMVKLGLLTMVRKGHTLHFFPVAEDKQVSLLSGAA